MTALNPEQAPILTEACAACVAWAAWAAWLDMSGSFAAWDNCLGSTCFGPFASCGLSDSFDSFEAKGKLDVLAQVGDMPAAWDPILSPSSLLTILVISSLVNN